MDYKYEVVLSFAGEQRDYVEKVAVRLKELNIKYFYDLDETVNLWGKNLSQYLDQIYYKDALYFIPFISKDYVDKIWTKLEFSSALDRNMNTKLNEFQQYILPVRFENIRVPGLQDSIGYIEANNYSPIQLAELIYAKVRGMNEKKDYKSDDKRNNTIRIKNIFDNINITEYRQLKNLFENMLESKAVLIYGEQGMGKKTVIERFLLDCGREIVRIKSFGKSSFIYEPLLKAFSIKNSYSDEILQIDFTEFLKKEILKCCQHKIILYFQNIESYEHELLLLCQDIVMNCLLCFPEKQIFIIFEYDSDDKPELINLFYQFPPQSFEIISFKSLNTNEVDSYLKHVFGNIKINRDDINYIRDASFGNIMYINIIVNHLKNKNIIYAIDNKFYCKKIKKGILKNVLKNHILDRYNRLDECLKEVLLKSTVIGEKFSSLFLSESFDIQNANEILSEIEEISVLIKHEEENLYLFENNESYKIIKEKINQGKQIEWHNILAKYFQKRLRTKSNKHTKNNIEEIIEDTFPVFYHFKESGNMNEAIPYAVTLMRLYQEISDFIREEEMINYILTNLERCSFLKTNKRDIIYEITKSKAIIKQMCSHYSDAITIYKQCVKLLEEDGKFNDIPAIKLNCAYCCYMHGDYQEAMNIVKNLKGEIENKEHFNYLYCQVLSLLASLYDLLRDTEKKNLYFTNALTIAKENKYEDIYYSLLKKASLVFYEEISIPMYEEAERYFYKTRQLVKQAEVLHNIATDSLYLNRSDNILKNAKKSIKLFDSIGNNHAHYPYNTCGLYELLFTNNYEKAHTFFKKGLKYKNEPFSEVTLYINDAICYIKEENIDKAEELLEAVDEIMNKPINAGITVFYVYHILNWAIVYYHRGEFERCLEKLSPLWNYSYLEQRHEYIAKHLKYNALLKLNKKVRSPIITAPLPILIKAMKDNIYFCTIRFFE